MSVTGWFRRLVSPKDVLPRRTVLAFVSDPLLAGLLDAALRPAGFDLLLATNVEDGIVAHAQRHPDLALVLVVEPMPGLSPRQLLAGLHGNIPCCVWAAEGEEPRGDSANPVAVTMPLPSTVAEVRRALLPLARPARREMVPAC
jgi:hypothetical protein